MIAGGEGKEKGTAGRKGEGKETERGPPERENKRQRVSEQHRHNGRIRCARCLGTDGPYCQFSAGLTCQSGNEEKKNPGPRQRVRRVAKIEKYAGRYGVR